ncbi:MAG: hypothetical protein NC206_03680 [Bacteroides sp.]|nr:hypothetical protein [Roseburia sp.]MCM1346167.1 hypothetical protein [Bacteroides sp.]MCM1420970.1 hypothetical protein [Bacteroides sp.]
MGTLSTTKERYEELKKCPLLFLRKNERTEQRYVDRTTTESVTYVYWVPMDKTFHGEISESFFPNAIGDYILVVVHSQDTSFENSSNGDNISFEVREASASDPSCWKHVIDSFIQRTCNEKDLYPYLYLIWFLNHYEWSAKHLFDAIRWYSVSCIPLIAEGIGKISQCLSVFKQKSVQQVLKKVSVDYTVYQPDFIGEAIHCINPRKRLYGLANNLFELVDEILTDISQTGIERRLPANTENKIIRLYKWLNADNEAIDYQDLPNFYCLVDTDKQHRIIQRYFHDVRLQKTNFDVNLLKQFKDNSYSRFSRYRYCMNTPQEKVDLSNSLLADCLITLYETRGSSFQSFDGILDFAITHCDVNQPWIDFKLDSFIPLCQGGAVYNEYFLGFIDYEVFLKLDETQQTDANLWNIVKGRLERYRKPYYQCSFDCQVLEERMADMCGKYNCENAKAIDQWIVPVDKKNLLNQFVQKKISNDTENIIELNIDDISIQTLRDNIQHFVCHRNCGNGLFALKSGDLKTEIGSIVEECSRPVSMRIYPQSYPVIGESFDILRAIKERRKLEMRSITDEDIAECRIKEAEELKCRCIKSLSIELQSELLNGVFFEVPYNEKKLEEIKRLYYVKDGDKKDIKPKQSKFLTKREYSYFCAPELAKERDRATNLPFFGCRGKECFQNSLRGQRLSDAVSWRQYSLFHLVEIIGYPKLHDTEAGLEPDVIVRSFIAIVNKVMRKFSRLRCRACGHLLSTYKAGKFNKFNFYSCINSTCTEFMRPIYLNYCYSCRKGLIDSRDSKQCPNGWYICPTCNACCNDSQFERIAQRYTIQHSFIPEYIKSKIKCGHNDKGIYYCDKCGTKLERSDLHEKTKLRCPTCKVEKHIIVPG